MPIDPAPSAEAARRGDASLEGALHQAQRLESLGAMAGGVAHDLNNMLQPVLVLAEHLAQAPNLPEEIHRAFQAVQVGVARSHGLVTRLLQFARNSPPAFSLEDLNTLLRHLEPLLRYALERHHRLELDLAPRLPPVLVDATRLEQAVLNLVINARDAMPAGGTIQVSTRLVASDPAGAPRVRLRVEDHGIGIPPHHLDRIFAPFFTTKPPGQGTGLGLSVVKAVAQAHGAALACRSVPGEGTTFELDLPADRG